MNFSDEDLENQPSTSTNDPPPVNGTPNLMDIINTLDDSDKQPDTTTNNQEILQTTKNNLPANDELNLINTNNNLDAAIEQGMLIGFIFKGGSIFDIKIDFILFFYCILSPRRQ